MARVTAKDAVVVPVEVEPNDDVSSAPTEWEWDTVKAEAPTKVVFDTIGDTFIGVYEGIEHITPDKGEAFDMLRFRSLSGLPYAINRSYDMDKALEVIAEGETVRIQYLANVEVAGRPEPMKSFRIDRRK